MADARELPESRHAESPASENDFVKTRVHETQNGVKMATVVPATNSTGCPSCPSCPTEPLPPPPPQVSVKEFALKSLSAGMLMVGVIRLVEEYVFLGRVSASYDAKLNEFDPLRFGRSLGVLILYRENRGMASASMHTDQQIAEAQNDCKTKARSIHNEIDYNLKSLKSRQKSLVTHMFVQCGLAAAMAGAILWKATNGLGPHQYEFLGAGHAVVAAAMAFQYLLSSRLIYTHTTLSMRVHRLRTEIDDLHQYGNV